MRAFRITLLCTAAVAANCLSSVAMAQGVAPGGAGQAAQTDGRVSQPAANEASSPLDLNTIVVTGATVARTKFETSYAITTLNGAELTRKSPRGIAELINDVPGIYVESSGGDVGNNVYSRGLPNDNYRYISVLEDGLPVFEEGAGAFTNADEFFRIDSMVKSAQIVRGGSASITASNSPGGVVNILTKHGTENLEGLVKVEGGSNNHLRTDVSLTGPLTDRILFDIGGFYRVDNGDRNVGYAANKGGQFRAGLTFKFDDGEVYAGYRKLDDHAVFYTAMPLASTSSGLPGLSAGAGTLYSPAFATVSVPNGYGTGNQTVSLQDGVHTNTDTFTLLARKDFGARFTVNEKARYTHGYVDFNGLFSNTDAPSAAFLTSSLASLKSLAPSTVSAAYRAIGSNTNLGAADIANGLIENESIYHTLVNVDNFINDLSGTFKAGAHKITLGYYFSHYTQRQQWNWNNILTEATNQPRLLDVVGLDTAGNVTSHLTANGVVNPHANLNDFHDDVTQNSIYLTDTWKIDGRLTFDGGVRMQHEKKTGLIAGTTTANLPGSATIVADNNVTVFSGAYTPYRFSTTQWAFSGGLNYEFNPRLATFLRYSNSFRITPEFAQWFNCCNAVETRIQMVEGGVKYASRPISAFVTGFFNDFPNVSFNEIAGNQVITAKASARSYGLEAEFVARPTAWFDLAFGGTLQSIKYQGFAGTDPTTGQPFSYSGKQIVRQPSLMASVRPTVHLIGGALDVFSDIRHTGKRYADVANTIALPAYTEVSLGADWAITKRLHAMGQISNLFNTVGLTEGNPRSGIVQGVAEPQFQGRPIFGRRFKVSMTYSF